MRSSISKYSQIAEYIACAQTTRVSRLELIPKPQFRHQFDFDALNTHAPGGPEENRRVTFASHPRYDCVTPASRLRHTRVTIASHPRYDCVTHVLRLRHTRVTIVSHPWRVVGCVA
eukprot:6223130-Pyramimonas_sp.AAC.1